MEQKLPHSLVAISRVPHEKALGGQKLDSYTIKNLWQAYHTSSRISNDATESRLECLFWRIWGSYHISSSVDVRTLDRLVTQIITPLPLPQLALSRHVQKSIKPKTNLISNTISPPPPAIPHSQSRSQLHSILKKPRTAQSEPQKTTRLLLERPDGQSITRIPSNPPTPNMSELSSKESQSSRPTNKKTCFSASRNTKRRQVFNHRKSSQTSVPKVSSASQQSSAPGKIFDSFDPLYDDDSLLKSAHNMQTDIISENEPGTSWLDVDSMRMSLPLSKQHNTALVSSQNTGLAISDTSHTAQQPNITPAVLAMSDKQDPILPQGIETVSAEPSRTHENEKQTSEPWTLSSSESIIKQYNPPKIEPEDIPHFPNAKSIPMPETMCTQLVSIINNPEPLDEWIPLPERPWFLAEHAWLPLVQPQYLFDWMIRDHTCIPKPQPSKKELVDKEFRSKFQIGLERARIVARREANVDVPVAIPEEDEEEVEG